MPDHVPVEAESLCPTAGVPEIDGRLAEVPLTMSYQPRWWMQVDLALADDVDSPPTGNLEW